MRRGHRSARRRARCLSRDRIRAQCSHWLALLAEAYRDTGRPEEGLRLIAEGLTTSPRLASYITRGELHRLDAELRLRLDPPDEQRAEAGFRRALETAGRQQAKSWELRAATSLAGLWGKQGRQTEARELLAPVYGWFTEGFDTADRINKGAVGRIRREPVGQHDQKSDTNARFPIHAWKVRHQADISRARGDVRCPG